MAGAAVVQIGTGSFINPSLALDVIDGMEKYLESQGIENIVELRGCV
jgi:dihydroorotate dehydrogenase (NAD+) catalytic subunit